MFPLIFLWFLRLTVAAPHRIIFIRSPSEIGLFPASAKQNVHQFNFANDLDKSKDENIVSASSNIETQQFTAEPMVYQGKLALPLQGLSNPASPQSFERSDLHLPSPIPNSRFRILIDTSSQSAVQTVVDYSGENNHVGDSSYGIYQPASHFSLQPLELTKSHASVPEISFGNQLEKNPLPPSSFNHPEFFPIPEPIHEPNDLGFDLELPHNRESIYEQNDFGFETEFFPNLEPIYEQNDLGFEPEFSLNPEPINEQNYLGIQPKFSPYPERIYEKNDYSDESIFRGVFSLASQPSASAIPLQNYNSLQRGPEPTPFDFGALRDSIPLAPSINYKVQNIPSPSHKESNLQSQQYVSIFGSPNFPPATTTNAYEVPISQTCSGSQILSYDGICVESEVIRSIHSFSEPKDDRLLADFRRKSFVHKPKVKLNLVVIQANEDVSGEEPLIVPPPQEKTVVLVLKKDGEKERKVIEISAPAGDSPEVFFVNYKDGENPVLPGGIDLHTALASSAKPGEIIRSSSSVPAFKGFESIASSNYEGPQLKGYNKRVPDVTDLDFRFGDKIVQP